MAQSSVLRKILLDLSAAASTSEICKTLYTIMGEIKTQTASATEILELLYNPKNTELLCRLSHADNEEFVLCAVQCIDETLKALNDSELTKTQLEVVEAIGDTLLHLHYMSSKKVATAKSRTLILLTSLALLSKIMLQCPNYAQTHVAELLGIAKANVNYGLESGDVMMPKKVVPTQNLLQESSTEEWDCRTEIEARTKGGGRVPKKRKPRALAKSMQSHHQQQQQQQTHFQALTLDHIVNDVKTSDSDASELENNLSNNGCPRVSNAQDRQKHAKVRLSAITLLGNVVTRLQERRVLYGYWHAFFENAKIPNNESQTRRSDLLYIALHDPNTRCRATALQIAGQIIFSSKNFLQQAECVVERLPTAYLPFAHSLGLQVVSMFEELTQILINESSLPVLTQSLKCLAVLVQANTPFQRFQPRNFIAVFVKEVQRLVMHRDATIQVAALMVLEFLIAAPELTPEISNAIGATYQISNNIQEQHKHEGNSKILREINSSFDEHIESDDDSEDDIGTVSNEFARNIQCADVDTTQLMQPKSSCWLLQRVLRNLGDFPMEQNRSKCTSSTTSVRIESLQVLAAMAQHFKLLESQLDHVANVIKTSLTEPQTDLRICAARCLDTIAYQIRGTLLEHTAVSDAAQNQRYQLEEHCLDFWRKMLPIIMSEIQSTTPDVTPSIKVCLCDALSNIGVLIFERQTHAAQMNLIGFLSGIACDSNEDVNVQCAAVRALAVYVLFPSLRGNLVFVENAAELALRLIGNTNVSVRVKASWALGNISDALLISYNNTTNATSERISEHILWRLISAATEACTDNDKVRCNAVRSLGNLLRLLGPTHFKAQHNVNNGNQVHFQNAISKLIDCLRVNGSAKVKWNTCYAIGNLLQNDALFNNEMNNKFDWQSKLYTVLVKVIASHPNFKVRINAVSALTKVTTRTHFGTHFEVLWKALLDAIEQSHHLDNFYEYNHRDNLQEQLCLAMSHLLHCAKPDDFVMLYKHLKDCEDILRNTWTRVVNRMVPEKSAPVVGCTAFLCQQLKDPNACFTTEQRNAISSIIQIFKTE